MEPKKISEKELLQWLNENNSSKFQKAVKYIGNNNLVKLGDELFNILKLKYNAQDGSNQSQYYDLYYLCIALGELNYFDATPLLETIAKNGDSIDTIAAGVAYIRLARKDKNDFSKIFEFVEMNKETRRYTTDISALTVMSNDKMVPTIGDQERFVEYAWNYISKVELQEKGYDYDHKGLALIASSIAGFEKHLSKDLLYKIYELGLMQKSYVEYFAKDALKGKYTYYNPTS